MGCDNPMEVRFGDLAPESPCGIVSCCCGSIIGLIMFILFIPCYVLQVDRLHFGLLRNKVTGYVYLDEAYMPGRYWVGFWCEFIPFWSTINTIEFSEEKPEEGVKHLSVLRSRDKEGKQIFLDVSIQYKLEIDKVPQIYREMTTRYEDVYISELRDVLSKAGNLFVISDAWEKYDDVVAIMKQRCDAVLEKRHAVCWGLQLWGVTLDPLYEEALIKTQVRKQAQRTETARSTHMILRAQTQIELATFKKDIKIVNADGAKQKLIKERNATANAEKLLTIAQAEVIENIRTVVVPNESAPKMADAQLTTYLKLVQLETMMKAPLLYHPKGGHVTGATEAAWARQLVGMPTASRDLASAEPVAADLTLPSMTGAPTDYDDDDSPVR